MHLNQGKCDQLPAWPLSIAIGDGAYFARALPPVCRGVVLGLESSLTELGFDRYDRNARLRPALLVVLPMLLVVAIWLPAVWTTAGALFTLVSACGATYLLARL